MSDFLRGDDEEVASFFAFQDVITAVLGILILIALQLSFSINILNGEEGIEEEKELESIISEEEFLENMSKRKQLEDRLDAVSKRNRELLANKQALQSNGDSQKTIEDAIRILLAEVERLGLDLETFKRALAEKREILKEEASKLGLVAVQKQVSELIEKTDEESREISELRRRLEELNSSLSDTMDDLAAEEKVKDSIWMIPERDDDGKEPLLISINKSNIRFEEFDKPESLRVLSTHSLTSSFKSGVEHYDRDRFKIVFFFKPSGAIYFRKVIDLAKEYGFEVGYDPIEESQNIIFSLPD